MRIERSLQVLTVLTTLATVAACSTYGRGGMHQQASPGDVSVAVWDSGPIDQDYQHQRSDLDKRHDQEVANPRAGESADQMKQRQATESKDLDTRYAAGKASHAAKVPDGDARSDDKH
jgi:hypothetical protein